MCLSQENEKRLCETRYMWDKCIFLDMFVCVIEFKHLVN